jgi:hypothetical protein
MSLGKIRMLDGLVSTHSSLPLENYPYLYLYLSHYSLFMSYHSGWAFSWRKTAYDFANENMALASFVRLVYYLRSQEPTQLHS